MCCRQEDNAKHHNHTAVEDRIKPALGGKKVALLFDSWSERGTHYVAMIESYVDSVSAVIDGTEPHSSYTAGCLTDGKCGGRDS